VPWSTLECELPLEQTAYRIHIRNTSFNLSDARNYVSSFPEPIRVHCAHQRATLIKKKSLFLSSRMTETMTSYSE